MTAAIRLVVWPLLNLRDRLHIWMLRRWLAAAETDRLWYERERKVECPRREAAAAKRAADLRCRLAILGALVRDE